MSFILYHFSILAMLLILSSFFSGTEAAFFSLKKADLYRFSRTGTDQEKKIARYMSQPDKILITLLLGNLFVNLTLTALSTSFLLSFFGHYGHFISIGFVTPLIILFGEITPKILAISSYMDVSRYAFPVFRIFHKLLGPVRFCILFLTDMIIRGFRLQMGHSSLTEDELGYVVHSGEKMGLIDKKESDIIKNVIRFSRREASNIMYPRNQAVFIEEGCSISEAMAIIKENDIVRVPVYRDDLDTIVGMIDTRDIMSSYLGFKKSRTIDRFIRPVDFFPFSKDLNELLHDFLRKKIQLAIIVDEYGGTAGIVTLNAILSALLGKDFGRWESYKKSEIKIIDENHYIVPGDLQIDEFNSYFSTSIESSNSDTIGGFVLEKMISFPARGDILKLDTLEFRVRNIVKRNIRTLEVTRISKGAH